MNAQMGQCALSTYREKWLFLQLMQLVHSLDGHKILA